jgi:hypothetical protein
MKRILPILILCILCSSAAFASFDFWGITLDKASYLDSDQNLTFNGVADSGVQYVVGGYKYSCVDGEWGGPYEASSPGPSYRASYRSDAQGLFFKATTENAKFFIITGSNQNGNGMPEVGFGTRQFGPGDLKIDISGTTYGIGLRNDNLLWAVDPNPTQTEFKIYKSDGSIDNINARDGETLGRIEKDPQWDRVGNTNLSANDPKSYAFFVKNSGELMGNATISFEATGIRLCNEMVYGYEVSVPWDVLGQSADNYSFDASYRPDCGNDIIYGNFNGGLNTPNTVPEPSSLLALSTFMISIFGLMKKK